MSTNHDDDDWILGVVEDKPRRLSVGAAWLLVLLASMTAWAIVYTSVAYIIVHFVRKFW